MGLLVAQPLIYFSGLMRSKIYFPVALTLVLLLGFAGISFAGKELPLKVMVNGEDKGDYIVTLGENGDILVPAEDIFSMGLVKIRDMIKPGLPLSLQSLSPKITYRLDDKEPALWIIADQDRSTLMISYSRPLIKNLSLYIYYTSSGDNYIFFAGFTFFAGHNTSISASDTVQNGINTASLNIQKNPPLGEGYGYNVTTSKQEGMDTGGTATFTYHGTHAGIDLGFNSGPNNSRNNFSADLNGSVAFINKNFYLSRPINDSFALVKVGDAKGVNVLYNGVSGTTDEHGELLIPSLISYYNNKISIDGTTLPVDYSFNEAEKYLSLPYRGGGVVRFETERIHAIEGHIFIVQDGKRTPAEYAGLDIEVNNKTLENVVGKAGKFYMESVPPGSYQARLIIESKEYPFDLKVPESKETIINLGDIDVVAAPTIRGE